MFSPSLTRLIDAFRVLPGVGPKSAQRMAFHLLRHERQGGAHLAESISLALESIRHCSQCRMFAESDLCDICRNPRRDSTRVCVVESPSDVFALEQNTNYDGHYFVLMGHLSPIDGIGPEELGLDVLRARLARGPVAELILAVGATVEGEATAQYIAEIARDYGASVTRIAHGVPVGGELEFVDAGTLSQAFSGRRPL